MIIKGAKETEVTRHEDGYVIIRKIEGTVTLAEPQVKALLDWLRNGNGLSAEADWNNGVSKEDV